MSPVQDFLTEVSLETFQNPTQMIGVPIAIVGAVFLSLGAQFQHRGVNKVDDATEGTGKNGLNFGQLKLLLMRPSWVIGTLMLGLAIVFQLVSLAFSPLILVQPLGAIALVVTAIVNSRVTRVKMTRAGIIAIAACVLGIGLFVGIAASVSGEKPVTNEKLITILITLAVVLALLGTMFAIFRTRARALFYIISAGVVYGFVATLAKVVISRVQQQDFDWLTILCVVGLLAGTGLGAYFVQNAYASGPPDLVIAGLTVVDPMVAVAIAVIVLGEADGAPPWAIIGFVVAGAIAVWGVFQLARHHPQVTD
ncbi:DMT family transporter [Mycetocola tolaasinivorans]|nr:DMT family transporter [Mycetocola tolaasinivorans]